MDFWISDWISADTVRDFFRGRPLALTRCAIHSPAPSELARKRKVASNPPTGAKRRTSQTKGKSEPTSISPQERLKMSLSLFHVESYSVQPVVSQFR